MFNYFKQKKRRASDDSPQQNRVSKKQKVFGDFSPQKNCVIYTRISSSQQISLEQQEEECLNFIRDRNYKVLDVIKEVSSARNFKKLGKLNSCIKNSKNINLVVYSLDRLCRDTVEGILMTRYLTMNNINLVCVKDDIDLATAAGKHAFRQRLSAAQFESDLISERVKRANEFKRRHGHYFGSDKFGYDSTTKILFGMKVKTLTINPEQQKVIKFIQKISSNDKLTLCDIENELSNINGMTNNIEIFEDDQPYDINDKVSLTRESIANILNDFNIPYMRGKKWTAQIVGKIRSSPIDIQNLQI